ncbi:MAG: hypothetical protein J0I86_17360 [Mesorhizobium sp.]|nr:hypothetical protein [Mesorhizobium sp.]
MKTATAMRSAGTHQTRLLHYRKMIDETEINRSKNTRIRLAADLLLAATCRGRQMRLLAGGLKNPNPDRGKGNDARQCVKTTGS